MSTDHLTTMLSTWIQSEDSDVPLIQRVDAAINDSKALIHKRLEVLSEKDALSGLDMAVEQVAAQLALSNELLANGTQQLNRIEEDVLPLLSLPLAELSQQLCSVEQFYSICRHVDNVKKFHIVVDSMLDAEKNQEFNLAVEKLNYAQDLVQTLELSVEEPATSFHADILEITSVASKDLTSHRLKLCDSAAHFLKHPESEESNDKKLCFYFLLEAREIIRGDLAVAEELYSSSGIKLRVSEVSVQLISLIQQMMKEARTSAEDCQSGLFVAVRDAVKLFIEMCPLVHRDLIFKLPQACALFHNSCIHIGIELGNFTECLALFRPVVVDLYDLAESLKSRVDSFGFDKFSSSGLWLLW